MSSLIDLFGLALLFAGVGLCLLLSLYIVAAYAHPQETSAANPKMVRPALIGGIALAILVLICPVFDMFFSYKQ